MLSKRLLEELKQKKTEKILKEIKKSRLEGNSRRNQTIEVVKRNIESNEKNYYDTAMKEYTHRLEDLAESRRKKRRESKILSEKFRQQLITQHSARESRNSLTTSNRVSFIATAEGLRPQQGLE